MGHAGIRNQNGEGKCFGKGITTHLTGPVDFLDSDDPREGDGSESEEGNPVCSHSHRNF